jgi:hypothetical protein
MTDQEKSHAFYKAVARDERPDFVPARIALKTTVCGDGPFRYMRANPGEHDCESNQWGAVSVLTATGEKLGVRISECEVVAWRENVEISHDRNVKRP